MKQFAYHFFSSIVFLLSSGSVCAQNITVVYERTGKEVILMANITDKQTNQPLDSVEVFLAGTIGNALTAYSDTKGNASSYFAQNVRHKVWLRKTGYVTTVDTFDIGNGPDTLRVDFELERN